MRLRTALINLIIVFALLVSASLFLGQLLGQPVLIGYVETGSMRPTLYPGDGFIAIPLFIEGAIEQGDVVVFHAETLHGGGLTTHRVVGETTSGFITRGDANPVTDQSSGEPPVSRSQIVATVLQINGQVVKIPYLGTATTTVRGILTSIQRQLAVWFGTRSLLGTSGLAYILFGVGVLSYAVSTIREASTQRTRRDRVRDAGILDGRVAIVVLTLLLVSVLTLSMVVPSGTQGFDFVSAENDGPGPSVIQQGTSETLTYTIPSNGLIPTVTYLEPSSEGVDVDPRRVYVRPNSHANATITLHAPDRIGPVTRRITEHRYLAVLPTGIIETLYSVHPWLPLLAINGLIGIGFGALGASLIGWGPVRLNSTRSRSLLTRLRRWLR